MRAVSLAQHKLRHLCDCPTFTSMGSVRGHRKSLRMASLRVQEPNAIVRRMDGNFPIAAILFIYPDRQGTASLLSDQTGGEYLT
jgi:hypothetical protein